MNDDKKIQIGVEVSAETNSIKAGIQGDQKTIQEFFDGVVPDFIKDGVGILNDQVKFWRFKRQIDLIKNTNILIESSGLPKQQIPLKVLVPIIENSTLEEDESVQQKWANMLANAITGKVEISPNYSAILKELSPLEVLVLDKIYTTVNKESDYLKRRELQFDTPQIQKMFNLSDEKLDLIIENLYRLNLLQSPGSKGASVGNYPFVLRTTKLFEFTTLGFHFVKACSWE